jgi:very-short-patch-repair endonuclease
MSSDSQEVRDLIKALTPKVIKCNEVLNAQNVGNALYGLQSMRSDNQEVRDLIKALTPKFIKCNEELNPQNVGMALYGFSDLVEIISADLVLFFDNCLSKVDFINFSEFDKLVVIQSLSIFLENLEKSHFIFEKWSTFRDNLLTSVATVQKNNVSQFQSSAEKDYFNAVKELLDCSLVKISNNQFLFGFESDIVIKNTSSSTIVNIEIDGPSHHKIASKKALFSKRRDKFLFRARGVKVHRLPVGKDKHNSNLSHKQILQIVEGTLVRLGLGFALRRR